MAASVVATPLNELDVMLQDLSKGHYAASGASANDYSVYSDFGSFTKASPKASPGPTSPSPASPPSRPTPPKSYKATVSVRSETSSKLKVPSVPRRPPRPPKLQHVLNNGRAHDLVKAAARDDDTLDVEFSDYEGDYGSSQPDYGITSNYSTLASNAGQKINIEVPKDVKIDIADTGEAPKGDESMVIKTDYGEIKSKYIYLGFGLWENTDPKAPPPPPKKPSPPPPPPKAEPIWYNCSVSIATHKTSKELDDLVQNEGYARMPDRIIEVGNAGAGIPGCLGVLEEPFEKEDMSEMFRRAFLEKMNVDEPDLPNYHCFVCDKLIRGRTMTAMTHKFHPECFVCTYCRKEFKERTFKTDPIENKPYCKSCFEKLLGHFGNAQMYGIVPT